MDQEPCLRNFKDKLAGGIYIPEDYTADAFKFVNDMTQILKQKGYFKKTQIRTQKYNKQKTKNKTKNK